MTARKGKSTSAHGWEMAFSWCPSDDAPLLGGDTGNDAAPASTGAGTDQGEVTRRYDRMAWLYDVYDAPMEWMGTRRRRGRLLSQATGRVLEVGVGTGKNLPHYARGTDLTGVDVSAPMLARAEHKRERLGLDVALQQADVTALPYHDNSFDTSVATSVFCSVADPVAGLRELGRVTKPEGRILLLEHVRPRNRLLGRLADVATIVTRRLFGFRANRRTEENVIAAGLDIEHLRREGVWREMIARPRKANQRP